MKIVHLVLGKANPERMNGVNKVVHQLAETMFAKRLDVEVWGITATPEAPTPARGYPLRLFVGSGRSFVVPPRLREAMAALPAGTCVHFHGVFSPVFYRVARQLKERDIPWVVSPHGAYDAKALQKRKWIKWVFYSLFDFWIVRHAHAVQAFTDLQYDAMKKWCGKTPVIVIPNGYEIVSKKADAFCERGHVRRPVFGFIGRVDRQKGVDLLLRGFALYKEKSGKGSLWIIGDGPEQKTLESEMRKSDLEQSVRFWGARFTEEKEKLLRNMDVFVHTSRWEGMPMAVLEAAAYGLPLIVSPETGLAALTKHYRAGLGLARNFPQDITEAFLQCDRNMADGELERQGTNAREMALREFDWGRIVERMLETLYKNSEVRHAAA